MRAGTSYMAQTPGGRGRLAVGCAARMEWVYEKAP